jgi:hypothetical protein
LSLEEEQAHLSKAEQDIVGGERRITEQIARIAKLRADGHDTAVHEAVLTTLQATLVEWYGHRDLILRTIKRLQDQQPRTDSAADGCPGKR